MKDRVCALAVVAVALLLAACGSSASAAKGNPGPVRVSGSTGSVPPATSDTVKTLDNVSCSLSIASFDQSGNPSRMNVDLTFGGQDVPVLVRGVQVQLLYNSGGDLVSYAKPFWVSFQRGQLVPVRSSIPDGMKVSRLIPSIPSGLSTGVSMEYAAENANGCKLVGWR